MPALQRSRAADRDRPAQRAFLRAVPALSNVQREPRESKRRCQADRGRVRPMLSLKELRRTAQALEQILAGQRLAKIVQHGDDRIVLSFKGRAARPGHTLHHILFCCGAGLARVSELRNPAAAPARPLAFAQYLRAHLDGARFAGARILNNDRQLGLALDAEEGRRELLLSVLGGRSNLYLLNEASRVEAFLRPLERTMRGLTRGAPW